MPRAKTLTAAQREEMQEQVYQAQAELQALELPIAPAPDHIKSLAKVFHARLENIAKTHGYQVRSGGGGKG